MPAKEKRNSKDELAVMSVDNGGDRRQQKDSGNPSPREGGAFSARKDSICKSDRIYEESKNTDASCCGFDVQK